VAGARCILLFAVSVVDFMLRVVGVVFLRFIIIVFPFSNFQEFIRACRISFFALAWNMRKCIWYRLQTLSSRTMRHPQVHNDLLRSGEKVEGHEEVCMLGNQRITSLMY
jgi:hypothetical protein